MEAQLSELRKILSQLLKGTDEIEQQKFQQGDKNMATINLQIKAITLKNYSKKMNAVPSIDIQVSADQEVSGAEALQMLAPVYFPDAYAELKGARYEGVAEVELEASVINYDDIIIEHDGTAEINSSNIKIKNTSTGDVIPVPAAHFPDMIEALKEEILDELEEIADEQLAQDELGELDFEYDLS